MGNMAFRGEDLGFLKPSNINRGTQNRTNTIATHSTFPMILNARKFIMDSIFNLYPS
jgi:hypothetical protein